MHSGGGRSTGGDRSRWRLGYAETLCKIVFDVSRERETLCCEGSACSLERGERVVIMGGDNTVFLSGIVLLFDVVIFHSFIVFSSER